MITIKNIIFDFYGVLINQADNSAMHETVDLMFELKDQGVRVFGLTNLETDNFRILLSGSPFLRQLEGIVTSGAAKASKPNPKIYQMLLDRYKLIPNETLFIDDSEKNVQGAKDLGIHGYHFTSAINLESYLISLGFFKDLPDQNHECCGSLTCQHH
jgi:2-haloacid dehalogenase